MQEYSSLHHTTCDSKRSVPVVLPVITEMLDPLQKLGRDYSAEAND